MLTPFKVMLGIWPPGENCPLTFVGLRASLNSPSPRSVWPRASVSGRTTPELSQRSENWPSQAALASDHVPTPLPGLLPFGLKPGLLHLLQPWHVLTHVEALLRASNSAMIAWPSPICCISFSSSLAAAASDCEAPGLSPACICLAALLRC